ncbi:hypothetical protein CTS44_17873 [Comamonas thiooxydans]|nr:hypothetical protein CTS44_17873 [Comamonas thiooxydans]
MSLLPHIYDKKIYIQSFFYQSICQQNHDTLCSASAQ